LKPTHKQGFIALNRKLDGLVDEELKAFEDGVGAAAVNWNDGNEPTERLASIEINQGNFKRYIWWEIMKCDVY
jgi:hypothetical protein